MTLHPVLFYKDFLGKPLPENPFQPIDTYATDWVIIILAKINALVYLHPRNIGELHDAVFESCFDKLGDWKKSALDYFKKHDPDVQSTCFAAPSILLLMAHVLRNYTKRRDNEQLFIPEVQANIFLAILAANEIYYSKAEVAGNGTTLDEIWKLEWLQQYYLSKSTDLFGVIPFKYFLFFRFIEVKYGQQFIAEFNTAFGIPSHYNFLLDLLQNIVNSTKDYEKTRQPKCVLELTDAHIKYLVPHTIDSTALTENGFTGGTHALVSQPFYGVDKNVVILDFHFFNHLADLGLLYNFYRHTSLPKQPGLAKYSDFQSVVAKQFHEEFLLVQIFKKLFNGNRDKVLSEDEGLIKADIMLEQNENNLFLIEIKSSRLNARTLEDSDTDEFRNFLTLKFANEKKQAGEKSRGVYQLLNHLKTYPSNIRMRIYPIIIYSEPVMDISGVNTFLREIFENEISWLRKKFAHIYPLTCINEDFFIRFYDKLKEDRFFLRKSIIDYHKRIASAAQSYKKSTAPLHYLASNYSFMRVMEDIYKDEPAINSFDAICNDFGFKEVIK